MLVLSARVLWPLHAKRFSSASLTFGCRKCTSSAAEMSQLTSKKKNFYRLSKKNPISTICLTSIQHSKRRLGRVANATMHASRTRVMLPLLLALLLTPASAAPALLGPAVGGDSGPAEAPTAVAAAPERAEDEAAGGIAAPPGSLTFRPRQHPSALSPEQRRGLEHEARCGPRLPVRRGIFPWPGWNPRCRGGGAAAAPAGHRLPPVYDAP